jgi:hypothetical protein
VRRAHMNESRSRTGGTPANEDVLTAAGELKRSSRDIA